MATLPAGHADAARRRRARPALRPAAHRDRTARRVRHPRAAARRQRRQRRRRALRRARAWPAGAPHVTALLLGPGRGAPRRPGRASSAAGGRVVDAPPSTVDLVRRRHRRHRRQRRPAPGRPRQAVDGRPTGERPGRRGRRRAQRGRRRHRRRARPARSRADVTVTFGCLKPAHVVGPAAPAGRPGRAGRHRPAARGCTATRRVRVPDATTSRALVAAAAARRRRSTPAAWSASRPARPRTRAPRVLSRRRRARRPGRDGPVRGQRRATRSCATHPSVIAAERVADAGRVQAWVCGSGLGTDETRARRAAQRCWPRPCRWCSTPTR